MIPTVETVESAPLVHRTNELFNMPGLTNFRGVVQVAEDITGVRALYFPPLSGSDMINGALFIDGIYFPATGSPVTYRWAPDRITRNATYQELELESVAIMPPESRTVIVRLEVTNCRGTPARVGLRFRLQSGIVHTIPGWADFIPPSADAVQPSVDRERSALIFQSPSSTACMVAGVTGGDFSVDELGASIVIDLPPGAKRRVAYLLCLDEQPNRAMNEYEAMKSDVDVEIARTRAYWNEELRSVFTVGNERYSGNLPILHTTNPSLEKLYYTGVLGVVYFKRDNPASVYGRAYDTLMPRYWQSVTFIWDYLLSSVAHALLDPGVMSKYLGHWMSSDIHTHFGSDYLTGNPVGPWYSVNDYAMCRLTHDFLRWNGDFQWLDRPLSGSGGSPIEHVDEFATNYRAFATEGGLANYGGVDNLLECVRSYVHAVASLNAGDVYGLRFLADLLDNRGDATRAQDLRKEANELLGKVQELYVEGHGYYRVRHPDGTTTPVRHCYDFITILHTVAGDLGDKQKKEMLDFFSSELKTERWMRALSPFDEDTVFSDRPDHQWNGAYPAWPAQALAGLFTLGEASLAYEWMDGLAESANQGPFGQAHMVASAAPPDGGGARKAHFHMPYITDWAVSGGGAWVSTVIESVFGVRATMFDSISASPTLAAGDQGATLENLRYQGENYTIDRRGAHRSG